MLAYISIEKRNQNVVKNVLFVVLIVFISIHEQGHPRYTCFMNSKNFMQVRRIFYPVNILQMLIIVFNIKE